MSSISATSSSNYLTPQQLLQAELQQEVNSGAISSSDQSALSSALNDISSALQGGSTDGAAAAGNTSAGDIQSKIDSLITNEVSSGKLTQQQATELQGVFQNAFGGSGSGASGGTPPAGGPPSWSSRRCRQYRRNRRLRRCPPRPRWSRRTRRSEQYLVVEQ